MGKPYKTELKKLANTYQWARHVINDHLQAAILDNSLQPLICIGSGGAFATAHFAAQLHETLFKQIAKALTPLQFVNTQYNQYSGALIISAGGRNADIMATLRHAIQQETKKIIVVTFGENSPLSSLAKKFRQVDLVQFKLPTGRDGFLATNSLIAFNLLLLRAYLSAASSKTEIPKTFEKLINPEGEICNRLSSIERLCRPLWKKNYFIVLHGSSATSAAIDLESRFTEAGLGTIQIADFRNFAHGRHHWLAKHGENSAVLTLITENDQVMAEKTLQLIPNHILKAMIKTPYSGILANMALTSIGLNLAGFAGESKGIDPGRPGVPQFGSKIYRLNVYTKKRAKFDDITPIEAISIIRKTKSSNLRLEADFVIDYWRKAYERFLLKIQSQSFKSLVFDYDGTLCDEKDRYDGINPKIIYHFEEILSKNFYIGVATGRGKSVRFDLQKKLASKYWSRIFIGYYNGSEISTLSDSSSPDPSPVVGKALLETSKAISADEQLNSYALITDRKNQITVEPKSKIYVNLIWRILQQIVASYSFNQCVLVRSSHSFDIINLGVSKLNLVDFMKEELGGSPVLCIGDKGEFPGNDYRLLSEPYSLSVDEVSVSPDSCWNLAPPGFTGVQATEKYLNQLHFRRDGFRIKLR